MDFSVSTWCYLKAYGDEVDLLKSLRSIEAMGLAAEMWLAWPGRSEVFARENWAELKRWCRGLKGLSAPRDSNVA